MSTIISNSAGISASGPKGARELGPVFAILEIDAPVHFKPKNSDSVPCESYSDVPSHLVCRFAADFNSDLHAKLKRRWACVAINGAMLLLGNVPMSDRPEDPAAFPPGAVTGLTYQEATDRQRAENDERMKFARVPLRWTIALRPLVQRQGKYIDAKWFWSDELSVEGTVTQ